MSMYSFKGKSSVDSIMRSSTVQDIITCLKQGDAQVISTDIKHFVREPLVEISGESLGILRNLKLKLFFIQDPLY